MKYDVPVLSTDQLRVDVEVDGVAGLVAPGGRVQGGADVQFVTQGLADSPPHHRTGLGGIPLGAVFVLNGVENLSGSHNNPSFLLSNLNQVCHNFIPSTSTTTTTTTTLQTIQ